MSPLSIHSFVEILVSLFPVFLFLAALIFLDSYKLISLRSTLLTIGVGVLIALLSLLINITLLDGFRWDVERYERYGAPVVEEVLKAGYLMYLIRSKKVGFMVDAAIYGIAIGAGFAFVENIYYLGTILHASIVLWIVRGFGTAIMHGGTTAIFGIIAKSAADRTSSENLRVFLPGLALAMFIHSFYNHFFLSPILYTLVILMALPLVMTIVFTRSEKATRNWLGVGFDSDVDLLSMITLGNFTGSNIGRYLSSLKNQFSGEVVVDMLCLLRIHVELSIRAKGILLMRQSGFRILPDPEIREKFSEMAYLRKNIGPTGLLAISPFLHTSSRDLWQLNLLNSQ